MMRAYHWHVSIWNSDNQLMQETILPSMNAETLDRIETHAEHIAETRAGCRTNSEICRKQHSGWTDGTILTRISSFGMPLEPIV